MDHSNSWSKAPSVATSERSDLESLVNKLGTYLVLGEDAALNNRTNQSQQTVPISSNTKVLSVRQTSALFRIGRRMNWTINDPIARYLYLNRTAWELYDMAGAANNRGLVRLNLRGASFADLNEVMAYLDAGSIRNASHLARLEGYEFNKLCRKEKTSRRHWLLTS